MSHFLVMVIGNNVDEQLAPYSEHITVAPYVQRVLSEKDKQEMLDFYNNRNNNKYKSFEEVYKEHGDGWDNNSCKVNPDGIWERWTTYNPKSKWDWYEVGGRWAGKLKLKEGVIGEPLNFSWGWGDEDKAKVLKENRADMARIMDILNLDEVKVYAVVKDGIWYERGEMGWWGMSFNEMDGDEWKKRVTELLNGLPNDTLITMVDCHI